MLRKSILVGTIFILASMLGVSCGVSKEEFGAIVTERDNIKKELQSITTDLESAKAELQSTKTELQSTKTELESVTKELQSTNTELQAIKSQLQLAMNELASHNLTIETQRQLAKNTWKDSEFVWLPLQYTLHPDECDEREEMNALVEQITG